MPQVVLKIQEGFTSNSKIRTSMIDAWKAYKRQVEKAEKAVGLIHGREELGWHCRPDVERLHELLEKHLDWDRRMVRSKLLPVLIEWDICHSSLWHANVPDCNGEHK